MTKITWKPIKVKLGEIRAWEDNPRLSTKAQAQRIIDSERKFGQPVPFLLSPKVDEKFPLIDGHQRLVAWLTVYGEEYVMDASVSDRALTDEEHRELVVTLHTGATGSWDWNALSSWDAGDLQEWGMNTDALKDWNNDANNLKELLNSEDETIDAEPQIDRAEELREKWGVELGDLWQVGEHRIICGDCTDKAVVDRLMDGEKADMVFTDPPYGIDLDTDMSDIKTDFRGWKSSGKNYEKVVGDDLDFDPKILLDLFSNCSEVFLWGADYYAERIPSKNEGSWVVWDKSQNEGGATLAEGAHSQFELCWSKKRHKRVMFRKMWRGLFGMETQDNNKRIHPTQKPIELAQWFLNRWSKEGGLIVDLYAGSGFTMVASQNLSRRCYAAEIAPKYCAVTLQRMSDAFPELEINKVDV